MGIDLRLSATHDLAVSRTGDLVLVDGLQRVQQQIKVTLLTFLGEWFLDTTFGIPYLESIMIKAPNRAEIEAIIRTKVREVPGVVRVPSVEVQIDAALRIGRITLEGIETDEGIVTVTVNR